MKKIIMLFVFLSTQIQAADYYDNPDMWNKCVEDFKDAQSAVFDVKLGQIGKEKTMIFRNGKDFAKEELNIFYKGRFWKAPLEIDSKFYGKKTLLLRIGGENFCFRQAFNFILRDASELEPYQQQTCEHEAIVTMVESKEDSQPTSQQVLEMKIKKDVERNIVCVQDPQKNCGLQNVDASKGKLQKWKMKNCALLNSAVLDKLIRDRNVTLGLAPAAASAESVGLSAGDQDRPARKPSANKATAY